MTDVPVSGEFVAAKDSRERSLHWQLEALASIVITATLASSTIG
jgi:hypothetical protein